MKRYETNGMYGKTGEYEPRLCAITTLPLQDGAVSVMLGNDYYFKVNPLVANKVTDEFKGVMRNSIPELAPKKTRKTNSEVGE